MSTDVEPLGSNRTMPVLLDLCWYCREGGGGECHEPACSLWMNRGPDVPVRGLLSRDDLIEAGAEALATRLVNPEFGPTHYELKTRLRVQSETVLVAAGVIEAKP